MHQQINYTQDDRDRTIRMEGEVSHLVEEVDDIRETVKALVETSRHQSHSIDKLAEAQKVAANERKEMLAVASAISDIQRWKEHRDEQCRELDVKVGDLNSKVQPLLKLIEHWKWLIGGVVATVGFLGWDKIAAIVKAVAPHI